MDGFLFNILWKSLKGVYSDIKSTGISRTSIIKQIRSCYNVNLQIPDIVDFLEELRTVGIVNVDVYGNYYISDSINMVDSVDYVRFLIDYKQSVQQNLN